MYHYHDAHAFTAVIDNDCAGIIVKWRFEKCLTKNSTTVSLDHLLYTVTSIMVTMHIHSILKYLAATACML